MSTLKSRCTASTSVFGKANHQCNGVVGHKYEAHFIYNEARQNLFEWFDADSNPTDTTMNDFFREVGKSD